MAGRKRCRCRPSAYRSSRRQIGGGHQRHAAAEQAREQAGEDHRVGDVGDEELVEADHARCARAMCAATRLQRFARGRLQFGELGVHVAHEMVEMHALCARRGRGAVQRREEQIHQQRLAAADAAPQIHAARRVVRAPREPSGNRADASRRTRGGRVPRSASRQRIERAAPRAAAPDRAAGAGRRPRGARRAPRSPSAPFCAAGPPRLCATGFDSWGRNRLRAWIQVMSS